MAGDGVGHGAGDLAAGHDVVAVGGTWAGPATVQALGEQDRAADRAGGLVEGGGDNFGARDDGAPGFAGGGGGVVGFDRLGEGGGERRHVIGDVRGRCGFGEGGSASAARATMRATIIPIWTNSARAVRKGSGD